jgi:hypothetical protein
MKLNDIAKEIREIISKRQSDLGLTFQEDKHIYTMDGKTDWPSVSKVLKKFYKPFPTEEAAYNKAGGDPEKQQQLIEEWAAAGFYSTNLGSRVHFVLEEEAIKRYGSYKEVRKPIFECDLTQLMKSDKMIVAGKRYLDLLEQREVVLLDTEIILGDPELGYTGQPDKVWLTHNVNKNDFGLLITDWKTNKPKNFLENDYTERMYEPFEELPNGKRISLRIFKKMIILKECIIHLVNYQITHLVTILFSYLCMENYY